MAILNPLSNAFGLDIGDRSFKLCQVTHKHRKNAYKIVAWGEVDVPEGVMRNGEIADMKAASEHVRQLVKDHEGILSGKGVVACLPEAKTFIKIIEIPADSPDETIRKEVLREIEQNIPLPANEIYFDWQILDPRTKPVSGSRGLGSKTSEARNAEESATTGDPSVIETEGGQPTKAAADTEASPIGVVRVLIGAAPKRLVDSYTEMLEDAGLAVVALEIEATAICRAILPLDDETKRGPVGVLDIGATRSSLVIYDDGIIQMSISIPVSGIAITEAISEALKVSLEDAEVLKKECGLDADRCEDKMWKVLLPLIDDMTDKIRNALRFYRIGFPHGTKIEQLLLCGGGAHFREIDSVLSRKLTVKVSRGDAATNLVTKLPKDFKREMALSYATAIGLAIRSADEGGRNRVRMI